MIDNKKISTAIKKAISLLQKIDSMIQDWKYCIDVIQQLLAVMWLLKWIKWSLLENHLHCCFTDAMESKDSKKKKQMIEEIIKITKVAEK